MRNTPATHLGLVQGPGVPGLVSVVIPTYNRAYILGDAIASALAQRGVTVEVVVADDGSTDDTASVVARIASTAGTVAGGPRVRRVYQNNAGVSAARNLGLRHARGEYVALLDSDDRWMPWKLAAQVGVMRRFPHVGMVWTDMSAVDDEGTVTDERHLRTFYGAYEHVRIEDVCAYAGTVGGVCHEVPPDVAASPVYVGDIFGSMVLGNLVHTSTTLIRRERLAAAGGFDEGMRVSGEDYEFHLRTCSHGPVALLDAPSTYYRVGNPDQLTAPGYMIDIARNDLRALLRWRAEAEARMAVPARALRTRLAESYGWLGEELFHHGDRAAARRSLARSVMLEPHMRQLAFLVLSICPARVVRMAYRALEVARSLASEGTLV